MCLFIDLFFTITTATPNTVQNHSTNAYVIPLAHFNALIVRATLDHAIDFTLLTVDDFDEQNKQQFIL
jgi:hypothetical protein